MVEKQTNISKKTLIAQINADTAITTFSHQVRFHSFSVDFELSCIVLFSSSKLSEIILAEADVECTRFFSKSLKSVRVIPSIY